MYKTLILCLLFPLALTAQKKPDYNQVDSLTYMQFYYGRWDELIKTGQEATLNKINSKYLQQRMGYAYFVKGDYYNSIKHYEKSLAFDKTDQTSHLYLYYALNNIGHEALARFHAPNIPVEMKKANGVRIYRPADAIDFEYSKKVNNYAYRSNPDLIRLGINSQIGYRFNLYQSVSRYSQQGVYQAGTINQFYADTQQYEYFAMLSWTASSRTTLSAGYHLVKTLDAENENYSASVYSGNIWLGRLDHKINRFDLGLSGSLYSNDSSGVMQAGVQLGIPLSGISKPYLKSSVYYVNEDNENSIIFSQAFGLFLMRKLWFAAAITLGDQNNFLDYNGLYLFNSLDHTISRSALSLYWYQNKHLTLYSNYSFDKKQIYEATNKYNQHSITGGIIWKF